MNNKQSIHDSELYNAEFKKLFLTHQELQHLSQSHLTQAASVFKNSLPLERRFNKDLYNFTRKEIEALYLSFESNSIKTLLAYNDAVKKYINYAIEQGYKKSNINPVTSLRKNHLEKFIAKYKNKFFTKKDFDDFVRNFYNVSDVAMVTAIFEGVKGTTYSEIINLKPEDLKEEDGKYYADLLNVTRGKEVARTLEISYNLYRLLHETNRQQFYAPKNGESTRHKEIEIIDSPYIFRPQKKGAYLSSDGKINAQAIPRLRIKMNELSEGKFNNMDVVENTGMIHYAKELYDNNGELTQEEFIAIADKYNKRLASPKENRVSDIKNKLSEPFKKLYDIEI